MAGLLHSDNTLTLLLLTLLVLSSLLDTADCGKRRGRRGGRRNERGNDKCSTSSVAEYKLTFHGAWSKEKFPRMYPVVRPPAQWSKLIGRTHAPTYHIWTEGGYADPALKRFAEKGDPVLYDSQPQGYHGIHDTFHCDPIRGGEGKTSTFISADGAHSKVSFVVKMVPSPDWFVGVDGLELCRRGRWRARAHVNLWPMDAGTDRGYTFTSPRWPSHPRETIYKITSSYPDHPASAFLYPEYRKLPRVGYVQVERVAQYYRRGSVSAVKSKLGPNVVVYGVKPITTVAPTTTTALNGSLLLSENATEALNSTEVNTSVPASAVVKETESRTAGTSEEQKAGNVPRENAGNPLPQQKQNPAATTTTTSTTTTPTTTTTKPTKTPSPTTPASTKAVSIPEAVKIDAEMNAPEKDIEAYQDDDAHAKNMVNDPAWTPTNGENLNESSRKHAAASLEDSTKEENLKSSSATKILPDDDEVNDPLPDASSSVHLGADDSVQTVDTARLSSETHPTSSRKSPAASSTNNSLSPNTPTTATTTTTTALKVADADTPPLRSSRTASSVPSLSSTSTSTRATSETSAKTVDTTKAAPRTSSPRQEDPRTQTGTDSRGRPQMRAGSYFRRRLRTTPPRPEARRKTGTLEPTASQSPHTFDEPQFVEVAVTDPYEDSLPVDCRVQEWSEWTSCSMSCGFGVRVRTRDVISYSKNGGFGCPVLEQEALCGSMRSCRWKHFSFIGGRGTTRPRRERVRRRRHHHDQQQRAAEWRRRYHSK